MRARFAAAACTPLRKLGPSKLSRTGRIRPQNAGRFFATDERLYKKQNQIKRKSRAIREVHMTSWISIYTIPANYKTQLFLKH